MPTLDDLIEDVKREQGFSDAAWEMYRAKVEEADQLRFELELLHKAFVKHRTVTHELLGSNACKTCQESDSALARARGAMSREDER